MDYESPDYLYNLLPAVYRIRDAEQGYQLRAFLRIVADQAKIVKEDIDNLWSNFFIETCDDWLIPYIGDLVGVNPLHDIDLPNRADVAKTIYYRRRKGTPPMLEELARDVTGWDCHAVEFFQLLEWNQNLNHICIESEGCAEVRDINKMDLLDSAFDSAPHTVDVRLISRNEGWHNLRNIGFFLWRLNSYPLVKVKARPVNEADPKEYRFYFSPLGNPAPLFHYPLREGDEAGMAGEIHVSGPIRPIAFHYDLEEYHVDSEGESSKQSDYYGPDSGRIYIVKDGVEVQPDETLCMNLKDWDYPPAGKVGIDVARGRIMFAENEEPGEVAVNFNYGFGADIGGGPYERLMTLTNLKETDWSITVRHDPNGNGEVDTISKALDEWKTKGKPNGIITIADNWTYEESLEIDVADSGWLAIEAANERRPTLKIVDANSSIKLINSQPEAKIILNGLLIEGAIDISGSIGELNITHCTLVPGLTLNEDGEPEKPAIPSIQASKENVSLKMQINHSIVGSLLLPESMNQLSVTDSIVHGLSNFAIAGENESGPPTVLERTTVLGSISVKELILATEVIFTHTVKSLQTQQGCVRFSYVPRESSTPRRFRCQPDLALAERAKNFGNSLPSAEEDLVLARLKPSFTSTRYGDPAYCQLSYACPEEIKTGAEDGSEMGAFCHLKQPQREANLRIRLEEYLPAGLKPGFIHVT